MWVGERSEDPAEVQDLLNHMVEYSGRWREVQFNLTTRLNILVWAGRARFESRRSLTTFLSLVTLSVQRG